METPPHKPAPPTGLREGLARALEAGGPECRPPGPLPAERVGRAVEAPPRRTPAVGARRASAAGSEETEAATDVDRRRDAPRASEGGEQWTTCQSECESPSLPPGRAGQGKEEGTQGRRYQGTWRKGQHPEAGQKGPSGQWGHEKSPEPMEQLSGGNC